ncbi:hypothetical protein ABEW05_003896 [Botrytis cinerea]
MSSSDSKYCEELIAERGTACGQAITPPDIMCDACFGRRDAALTAYGRLLDNRGAEKKRSRGANNKAAPLIHDRQMSRNTKEFSKTRSGPRALAEDPRSSRHKKEMNTNKRRSSNHKQGTQGPPYPSPYPPQNAAGDKKSGLWFFYAPIEFPVVFPAMNS